MARILYVEDFPSAAWTMEVVMRELGHDCVIAPTGNDAVMLASAEPFDAILLDAKLPDLDGPGVAKLIRKTQTALCSAPTPIIGFSADGDEREACLAAGMDGFHVKSLSVSEVRQILDAYL